MKSVAVAGKLSETGCRGTVSSSGCSPAGLGLTLNIQVLCFVFGGPVVGAFPMGRCGDELSTGFCRVGHKQAVDV